MPLYSDMYHNYIGNTPTSSISYTTSYSLPSYSSAYSSGYTPAARISNISRYLPKLQPISETPLTKHRIAALQRLNSPKPTIIRRPSPKYVPPRPRRINTSDIDVSAHRFANRRISDPKVDTHYTERKKSDAIETIQENIENKPPTADTENTEEQPERVFGRSTIRRDRAMVRLKTVRLRSKSRSKSPEVKEVKEIKVKKVREYEKIVIPIEADPGYVSTETNSGSWRDNFEFDLKKESKSPTTKSPGEILIEKHFIKDEIIDVKPLLTIDDIPVERRKSVRRRSAAKLPSFKEICSDISSDKLSDDLNAGDLRRKASLIIEEEINKIRQSASGTFHCLLEEQLSDNDDGMDKRKSRKVKKLRQKITAKVEIENPEPSIRAVIGHVEVNETTFDNNNSNNKHHPQLIDTDGSDIKNKTIKLPLKKKKIDNTDIKSTCSDSMMSTNEPTNAQTPAPTTNANTKITSADIKTNESDANAKKIPVNKIENCDLDSKLLLETNATSSTPATSAPVSVKKIKKIVKTKSLVKEVVIEPELPKMNPLKRDPSADDFWGMIGSRETIAFTRRKQKVVEEQQQKMQEISWLENEEVQLDSNSLKESSSAEKIPKTLVDDATLKPKPEVAKQVENKNESVIVQAKADVIIVSPPKADEKSNLLSKLENKMPSQMAEKQIESKKCDDIKIVKAKCDAKVAELKLGQQSKVDENKLTENKEVVNGSAEVITALSKDPSASAISKKEKSLEKSPEKTFVLQEVPKPKKIVSKTIEANGITEKIEEAPVALPKSPPWKLSKKTEEKLPLSPKSPTWKTSLDKEGSPNKIGSPVESPVKKVLEKSKSPETPKPVVLKTLEKSPEPALLKKLEKSKSPEPAVIKKLEKSKSPEPPKPAVLKTLEKSPEPALLKKQEKSKSPEQPKPAEVKVLEKSPEPSKPAVVKISEKSPEPALLKKLEKSKSPEPPKPPKPDEVKIVEKAKSPESAVLKKLEKSLSPEPLKPVLNVLEKAKSPEPPKPAEIKILKKAKSPELPKPAEVKTLEKAKSPEPAKPAVEQTVLKKLEKSKSPEPAKPAVLTSLEKSKSPEPPKPAVLKTLEKKAFEKSKSVEPSAVKPVEKKPDIVPKLKPVELKASATTKLEDKKEEEKVEAVDTVKLPAWKQALLKNKTDKDAANEINKKVATKIETKSPSLTKLNNVTAATADAQDVADIEKVTINESKKVNENIEPLPVKVCEIKAKKKSVKSTEGQKLETKEATATTPTSINTLANVNDKTKDNITALKNALSNSKSLGNLSKFPTVNNLNSYATMNDKNNDKQHQHTAINENTDTQISHDHNKSIAIEQSIIESTSKSSHQTQEKETIKDTTTVPAVPEKKVESESEEEDSDESSYETDSEDWTEDEMGRKDFDPQRRVKLSFENMKKCYVKDEKATITLVARPRPLWKIRRNKHANFSSSSESEASGDDNTSETRSNGDSATGSSHSSTNSNHKIIKKNTSEVSDVMYDNITALMPTLTTQDEEEENGVEKSAEQIAESELKKKNRLSTSSQDSGFCCVGATAPKSPRKMLDCDVNCHKKCEKLAANLCGVNQKLIVEALACVRRGTQERLLEAGARDASSRESLTPPSLNPAYKIDINHDDDLETSYTYAQFQKTGKLTAPATVIPRFRKYNVEDFHFLTVLGKGSFGKVFLAELRNTEYYYAVKCLKKDVVLEDDDVECTLIERKVLALGTKHPYLCHLFCTFQTDSHLFFVMEYLNGGDLMFHIQQSGRFTEKRARFYGAEIVSGLKFLHRKGIVYRDLKLDNVLLDYDGHVRIADFGMCKLEIYLDKTADSFCGTPDYMAPEIIKGTINDFPQGLHYNQAVDWWSFGVLMYEMLIGQSPFSGCDEDELFWSICNEIPWYPHFLSKEALKILQSLLEKDVSIRLGVMGGPEGDIKYHPFFNEVNWDRLEKREVEPPFKPQVRHPLDTQYFDSQFTRERARLTPIDRNILQSMNQKQFEGFSFTNPNATLTKLLAKKKKKQPKMPKFYFCPYSGDMKVSENLY